MLYAACMLWPVAVQMAQGTLFTLNLSSHTMAHLLAHLHVTMQDGHVANQAAQVLWWTQIFNPPLHRSIVFTHTLI